MLSKQNVRFDLNLSRGLHFKLSGFLLKSIWIFLSKNPWIPRRFLGNWKRLYEKVYNDFFTFFKNMICPKQGNNFLCKTSPWKVWKYASAWPVRTLVLLRVTLLSQFGFHNLYVTLCDSLNPNGNYDRTVISSRVSDFWFSFDGCDTTRKNQKLTQHRFVWFRWSREDHARGCCDVADGGRSSDLWGTWRGKKSC